MRRVLLACLLVCVASEAVAATRYISPTGSNGNDGQTTGTPWLTFAHALSNTVCGDTLLVMDGTYTSATTGALSVTKVCTQGAPYTVSAVNSRVPLFSGTGSGAMVQAGNAAWIVFNGLRVKSTDNVSGNATAVVNISTSADIQFINGLVSENNRYFNNHLIQLTTSSRVLIQDTELYGFHRHGILIYNPGGTSAGENNTVRRVYCHGRNHADIVGGYVSGPTDTADACVAIYPASNTIVENVMGESMGTLVTMPATAKSVFNQVLGSAMLVSGGQGEAVVKMDARGATLTLQPNSHVLRNVVSVGSANSCIRSRSALNIQVFHATCLGSSIDGIAADIIPSQPGSGTYSFFCTDCLSVNNVGRGLLVQTGIQTWTVTNSNAFGNGTNYDPATSTNYAPSSPPSAVDPQMGACYLWPPDGSAAKTNGWGATILYRYVDGVLTTEPLWNTVTGEFPFGAVITGVNDTASTSAYNMHTRFRVNSGGCTFPASFGGSPPAGPATYETSEGTTSTTHNHVIDALRPGLLVCVSLWRANGGIGSVSAVTSGGEALALIAGVTSPAGIRRAELWQKLDPTAGTRSIAVTTTGPVDGVITTSMEVDNVESWNTGATAGSSGTSIAVTATTDSDETLYDCLTGGKAYALSVGPGQTLQVKEDHDTQALRLATGTQAGLSGGVIEYFNSNPTDFGLVVVSAAPTGTPGGGTASRTLSKYQIACERAVEASPCAVAGVDVPGQVSSGGRVRIKTQIDGAVATSQSWGLHWYCRKNEGGYARAMDAYGANAFRFTGPGADTVVPSSLTAIVTPFSGTNYVTGFYTRDQNSVVLMPALTATQHTDAWADVEFTGTVGDTFNCRPHLNSGSTLNAYTVTPTITVVAPNSAMP